MKRILVTGATGFVGSPLVERLLETGFEVVASSALESNARQKEWFPGVQYRPLDLNALEPDFDYFRYFLEPDILIHLAWPGLPNYKEAFHLEQNLPQQRLFLENMVRNGLRDLSVTGTCFEYGLQEGCLSEDQPVNPGNAYAMAKNLLHESLKLLQSEKSFHLKWIRLFYMYGKGQSANSLLSQLRLALERGDDSFNMSPGDQLRDYLPIETVAEYVVKIATQQEVEGTINCCSGKPVSVLQLVKDYLASRGANIKLNLGFYPYSDLEPRNFWGDTKKLKTILENE